MNEQGPTDVQLALTIQRSNVSPLHVAGELSSHGRSKAVALYDGLSAENRVLVDAEANTLHDAGIGATLAHSTDFPVVLAKRKPLLFHRGDPPILNEPTVSVLGARWVSKIALREAQICGEMIAESGLVTVTEHRSRVANKVLFGALEEGGRCVVVLDEGITRYQHKRRLASSARTPGAQLSAISLLKPTTRRSEDTTDDAKDMVTDLGRCLIVIGLLLGDMTALRALHARDLGRPVLILDTSDVLPTKYDRLLRKGAVAIQDFSQLQAHLDALRTQ